MSTFDGLSSKRAQRVITRGMKIATMAVLLRKPDSRPTPSSSTVMASHGRWPSRRLSRSASSSSRPVLTRAWLSTNSPAIATAARLLKPISTRSGGSRPVTTSPASSASAVTSIGRLSRRKSTSAPAISASMMPISSVTMSTLSARRSRGSPGRRLRVPAALCYGMPALRSAGTAPAAPCGGLVGAAWCRLRGLGRVNLERRAA